MAAIGADAIQKRISELQKMKDEVARNVLRSNPDFMALEGAISELTALLPREKEVTNPVPLQTAMPADRPPQAFG